MLRKVQEKQAGQSETLLDHPLAKYVDFCHLISQGEFQAVA